MADASGADVELVEFQDHVRMISTGRCGGAVAWC
jgi:hypothetical protein